MRKLLILCVFSAIVTNSLFAQEEQKKKDDGKIVVGNSFQESQGLLEGVEYSGFLLDFKNHVTQEQMDAFEEKHGFDAELIPGFEKSEKFAIVRKFQGKLKTWLSKLAGKDILEGVEPNYILSAYDQGKKFKDPNPKDFKDPFYKHQWHMAQIRLSEAFSHNRGKGAVVAVIDTGVAYEDHGRFKRVRDLNKTRFVKPYNFINNTKHANDDHGHGTHVAGTIAQSTNNGLGVVGIAPEARIMPLKVLDGQGRGGIDGIARAIRYAADNGAQVVNMSLGGPLPSRILRKACQYASKKGVLLVCAAGNSGGSIGYPAKYPECMAVSAVQYDETLTFYSSRGKEIEIAAPGGNIRVDQNKDGYPDGVLQNSIYARENHKDDYMLFMGTSMAAPHVAGAAALLVSAGVTDAQKVRKILKDSARKTAGPKEHYGAGLLDAAAALEKVLDHSYTRLGAGLLLGLLVLKSNFLLLLHPLSLLGMGLFGSGFFLHEFSSTPEFLKIFTYPIPEWDQFLFGADGANPIFRSSFWLLFLVGFCFQLRRLRPFMQGVGFGLAGYFLVSAVWPMADLVFVPDQFYTESFWYLANAGLCAFLGGHSMKSDQ